MRVWMIGILLILLALNVLAHNVATGDPAHDANHVIDDSVPEVPDYSASVPPVLIFFAGLIIFAFAMGYFLHVK